MIKTFTSKSILNSLILGGAFFLTSYNAEAQVSLITLGAPYSQDFNTLSNTGTANVLAIPGWVIDETGGGARDNELYAGDTGASNTGDTYSYGTAATAERALGSLASGTLISTFGSSFANNTGSLITDLVVGYTGEQWRLAVIGRQDSLVFQYSLDATSLTTGTWVSVPAMNFKSPFTAGPIGALDGNAAANRTSKLSAINGLLIPNGSTFWIRWSDPNIIGSDDGLAIDDVTLVPMFTNNISVSDVVLAEGNAGLTSFDFTVSLSAPADLGGVTFDITTMDGSATSPVDFISNSLTGQTIPAGMTSYTFSVTVNGDVTPEMNDSFYVNISNVVGANITDGQGLGIIVNEDFVAPLVVGQPSNTTVCSGDVAMFSAQATGDPTPTVQWQVSTNGGTNWNDVPLATATTHSFTASSAQTGNMYWAIFTNGGGADTTVAVTLTVNPTYSLSESFSVCSGDDYTFPDGSTTTNITNTVVHLSSLNTLAGCDSNIVTTVSVNPVYNINETATVCNGDDYTYPDGVVANNVTGTVSHTSNMTTLLGCDSIINTTVNVNPVDTTTATPQSICMGDSALFYGNYISTAGMHYHTLTNMFGCDSVIEIDLIVNPLPIVAYSFIIDVDTVDFTNTSTGGTTYLWDLGDGNGFSNTGLNVSHIYPANATYTVCLLVTSADGCSDTVCSSVVIQEISIKKLDAKTSIALYPNPAKDNITIAFATEVKTGTVKLINAIGQVVLTKEVRNASELNLNLNTINKGVYFVQIENNGSKTVKRLIIE